MKRQTPAKLKDIKKPSQMLRLAVDDLEAMEDKKGYKIDMTTWHSGASNKRELCLVCLAGAVMANTVKVPRDAYVTPTGLIAFFPGGSKWPRCIRALNAIRNGWLSGFINIFYGQCATTEKQDQKLLDAFGAFQIEVENSEPTNKTQRKKLRQKMLWIADKLETVGL